MMFRFFNDNLQSISNFDNDTLLNKQLQTEVSILLYEFTDNVLSSILMDISTRVTNDMINNTVHKEE